MATRKYTPAELDRMRDALHERYPKGPSYVPADRAREVEDHLRTHILNGTEPEELETP